MNSLDEKVYDIYEEVVARNPGENEFHQAVYEVLNCLGPVVAKHPDLDQLMAGERTVDLGEHAGREAGVADHHHRLERVRLGPQGLAGGSVGRRCGGGDGGWVGDVVHPGILPAASVARPRH